MKRENVIETLEYRFRTQISTESHFLGDRYMMSCVEDNGMRFGVRRYAFKFLIRSFPV